MTHKARRQFPHIVFVGRERDIEKLPNLAYVPGRSQLEIKKNHASLNKYNGK